MQGLMQPTPMQPYSPLSLTPDNCINHLSVIAAAGMYEGKARKWRVKSRHTAGAITAFDVDDDGLPEIITGWSSGRVSAAEWCFHVTLALKHIKLQAFLAQHHPNASWQHARFPCLGCQIK